MNGTERKPNMQTFSKNSTIGEIVAGDYRTAKVFERYKIDFCCGGNIPLESACELVDIDLAAITTALEAVKDEHVERGQNYGAWELPFLVDYIVNVHHGYLKENTGQIAAYARKIASVHGARHPETVEIAGIFDRIAADLAVHLKEEEEVLFPKAAQLL